MSWVSTLIGKLNPAQSNIVEDQGDEHATDTTIYTFQEAYNNIESVNRGCNLLTDSSADIMVDVGERIGPSLSTSLRPNKLGNLLNFSPNPFITANEFKRNIYLDLILDGNAFVYFDGAFLYNLPATNVVITSDKKTFIEKYTYSGKNFSPDEIIHIKDNSSTSIFRGTSRLTSAEDSIKIMQYMIKYQTNFFKNNAIPGIVLKTPNVLSKKVKDRIIMEWRQSYTAASAGAKTPVILDGEFTLENLTKATYKDLDFAEGILSQEEKILKAIGIPPILLNTGNNANITPNIKLFYLNTVIPLVTKTTAAFERYFGYDLKPITQDVQALRPELKELANYLTSLTNAGIITRNEAREKIRLTKSDDPEADRLIVPANIAGSAVNPAQGGKPKR